MVSTKDMNKTDKVSSQGPLSETLKSYERWNINEIADPTKDGTKKIAPSSKP